MILRCFRVNTVYILLLLLWDTVMHKVCVMRQFIQLKFVCFGLVLNFFFPHQRCWHACSGNKSFSMLYSAILAPGAWPWNALCTLQQRVTVTVYSKWAPIKPLQNQMKLCVNMQQSRVQLNLTFLTHGLACNRMQNACHLLRWIHRIFVLFCVTQFSKNSASGRVSHCLLFLKRSTLLSEIHHWIIYIFFYHCLIYVCEMTIICKHDWKFFTEK